LAGVLFGAGRGTTSGSYSGRVQQFLDPLLKQLDPVGQLASRPIAKPLPASQPKKQGDDQAEAEGIAVDESVEGAPITDLDQEGLVPNRLAQLPPEESSAPSQELAAADSIEEQTSEIAGKSEFRLVPVRSPQSKVSTDSSPGFKMVPVSDIPNSGFGSGTSWQQFASGTLFDQIKGLLALVGLFYVATLLVSRRE